MSERLALQVGPYSYDAVAAGPEDGPLVLLLHGFPQTSAAWRELLPLVAEAGYRVVAPDQRGYSPGARPQEVEAYRTPHLVADALGFADALGAERFWAVGHDWGGAVVWNLAGRHPERLLGAVVLSTPHPHAFTAALRTPQQAARSAYMALFRLPFSHRLLSPANLLPLRFALVRSGLPPGYADEYLSLLREQGALEAALHWYRAADATLVKGLPPIRVPTLYVWGEGDPALGRAAAERSRDHVEASYRFEVLPKAGHWLPERASATLAPLLLSHLGGRGDSA